MRSSFLEQVSMAMIHLHVERVRCLRYTGTSTKHRPPHMKLIHMHNEATESSYFRVIVAIGTAKAHIQYAKMTESLMPK
ncbi:hypothetical protein VNO77_22292 [Canavalia gladiata]|uniref:Uncharacterized protein n=1 Tax=Canavalia gladiata TaxID=3824 RepID=A0AAN9Q7W1_CANGL